ncbi:MAG: hypothetical protein SGJ27_09785, partial [Candidatus Melainabacteria bacterium]|nr:hypothetical protein [Candidatus Melainabacteria bacterium]
MWFFSHIVTTIPRRPSQCALLGFLLYRSIKQVLKSNVKRFGSQNRPNWHELPVETMRYRSNFTFEDTNGGGAPQRDYLSDWSE